MEKRKILLGCLSCDLRDNCPLGNKPVEAMYSQDCDFNLSCFDLLDLYQTFQEIAKRIKNHKEQTCGKA